MLETVSVLRNEKDLAERFKFELNQKQSLAHFLVGPYVSRNASGKKWIPKLQEFLSDFGKKRVPTPITRITEKTAKEGANSDAAEEKPFKAWPKRDQEIFALRFLRKLDPSPIYST